MTYGEPPPQPRHFPEYVTPNSQLAQAKTSASAIASLVLGILACVPAITSVLAVIFAIVGIRGTRHGQMRGRGMAIAGLVLGLVGIAGWGLAGVATAAFFHASQPAAATARQFTIDLTNGNVAAAQKNCDTSLTTADLQKLSDQCKSFGSFSDLTLMTRFESKIGGVKSWRLEGSAEFSGATKFARFVLIHQPDGSYKISEALFR